MYSSVEGLITINMIVLFFIDLMCRFRSLLMNIIALMLGWVMIGAASAFILAATFFDIKEKNLEEDDHDL